MNFNDIFKSSFLESVTEFSILDTVLGLGVALVIGMFIFIIYKTTLTGVMYSSGFALTLVGLSLVTTLVIMAVTSNVVLSLGMVGALSIVRYRTAIKDPLDLVFLFWAISEGIICGAGMGSLAAMLAVILTVGLFVLEWLPAVKPKKLMNISAADRHAEDAIMATLKSHCKNYTVKSKAVSTAGLNLIVEFSSNSEQACIEELVQIDSVHSVSALTHDGEVTF